MNDGFEREAAKKGDPVHPIWTEADTPRPERYPLPCATRERRSKRNGGNLDYWWVQLFGFLGMLYWVALVGGVFYLITNGYLARFTVVGVLIYLVCVIAIGHVMARLFGLTGFLAGMYFAVGMTLLCPFSYVMVLCGGVLAR